MKGMQKIKRGKQFAGVVLYSLKSASHHKITPYVIGGNMTGSTAAELISEFEGTRLLRPDVAKPVWHNSLRLPKGECLSTRQWAAFADDYIGVSLEIGNFCTLSTLFNQSRCVTD